MNDWMELNALADGELSGEDKTRVEKKIRECEQTRADYELVVGLKGKLVSVSNPTSQECARVWSACRVRLEQIDQRTKVEKFVTRYAWGLCGAFLVAIVGAAYTNRIDGGVRTGDVARVMAGLTPGQRATATYGEDLQKWLSCVGPIEVDLGGAQVLQAREGQLGGRSVAILDIIGTEGRSTLVLIGGITRFDGMEPMVEDSRFLLGRVGSRNCLAWKANNIGLMLIGDGEASELARTAEKIRIR
ncbi:MAG: hypothetical protein SNJ74_02380 [Fimbriimonadaceae bacterium]